MAIGPEGISKSESDASPTELEVVSSLSEIEQTEWNALVRGDFLFADYRFLKSLEDSGSLGRRTGWLPRYLIYRDQHGRLLGATPLFLKTNSYGEFIFDWGWANAAHAAGLHYYPKLTAAIPFTPATGPKFLLHPDAQPFVRRVLIEGAREVARQAGAHSVHFLFTTEDENRELEKSDYLIRHSFQYHWQNRGWTRFSDFLAALRSKRRQEIRREREAVARAPLSIEKLTGQSLTAEHAQLAYDLYSSTSDKMGGYSYLTPEFFQLILERMPEHVLFVVAKDSSGEVVAGSFNLFSGQTLYGRYWGCHEEYRNLHFEICYYQTNEWALENGIQLFEAGAQGEHKFNRGFRPQLTWSAHWLEHPALAHAVGDFIEAEKRGLEEVFEDYRAHDPYKREGER